MELETGVHDSSNQQKYNQDVHIAWQTGDCIKF